MWLSGWGYRKQITITGATGAGTNYQICLKVGESSGATGANFHLENHSANFPSGKDQGGDLRFTASDGTSLLDFWVEKADGTTPNRVAYIWVEVSADLGSEQNIFIYYGNSSATNYSNGDNTFMLFDDFLGTSLDGNKWQTENSGGSISVANSYLSFSNSGGINYRTGVLSVSGFAVGIIIRKAVKYDGTTPDWGIGLGWQTALYGGTGYFNGHNHPANGWYLRLDNWNGTTLNSVSETLSPNTWYRADFGIQASKQKGFKNSTLKTSATDATYNSDTKKATLAIAAYSGYPTTADIDWASVGKWVDPEPAFNTAGTEETAGSSYSLTLPEEVAITDSKILTINKFFSESITVADIVSRFLGRQITETLVVSSKINRMFGKMLNEAISISDLTMKYVLKLSKPIKTLWKKTPKP